jgi:transposase
MLDFMERSSIKLLKKRGNTDTEIAKVLGRDRKTVRKALAEPADKQLERPKLGLSLTLMMTKFSSGYRKVFR